MLLLLPEVMVLLPKPIDLGVFLSACKHFRQVYEVEGRMFSSTVKLLQRIEEVKVIYKLCIRNLIHEVISMISGRVFFIKAAWILLAREYL